MRPELTLGRATAHVVRRWWLLPLCAVLVAIAATTLSGRHISDAKATARVHVQDTTVTYQFQGQPQPFTTVHAAQDLTKNEFVDPQAAAAAAAALKNGTTARQYIDNLGFAALDGTDIQLSYSDNSSEAVVAARLNAYVKALVHQRISNEKNQLLQAANTLQSHGGDATAVARLQTAANNLPQGIHADGTTTTSAAKTLPGARSWPAGSWPGSSSASRSRSGSARPTRASAAPATCAPPVFARSRSTLQSPTRWRRCARWPRWAASTPRAE